MKSVINKFIVLFMLFLATVGVLLYTSRIKVYNEKVVLGSPTLPVMSFFATGTTGGAGLAPDIEVNRIFGYTTPMEMEYMRDTITPVGNDRRLIARITNMNNVIMGASFELRSLDCERLIEDTKVKASQITDAGDYTNLNLEFQNLISMDTEYMLVIKVQTDRHEEVYFYTRIEMFTDNYCKMHVDFAKNFSECIFDEMRSDSIISYLEPKSSMDNSNLGFVNINSTFDQITWGNLKPEKISEPVVSIKEMLGDIGCVELNYQVRALNDFDVYQYYNVKEYFRIRWTATEMYLMDYQRTMEQIFEPNNQNISPTRINMGIYSDIDSCVFKSSESTKYIAFSKCNGLWLMDIDENKVTSLMDFFDVNNIEPRNFNYENDTRIISVDDKGNVEFIVYGYMTRGNHEGMVGVSLYYFDNKKNVVEEEVFIPFTKPHQLLKETVGKLAYVNANKIMYLMLNDGIYSIDLTGSEYVQTISGLKDGSYAVNEKGDMIAWQSENTVSGCDKIKVLNFETGEEKVISAESGQKLHVIGFVDNDLAYGISNQEGIRYDLSGVSVVPMHALKIMDIEKEETLKDYYREGIFFTDTEIEGNMINISRMVLSEQGNGYVKSTDYQIFGNEEEDVNVVNSATITTDLKQTEVIINYVAKVTTNNKLSNLVPDEIKMGDINNLSIRELESDGNKFYVYGYGKVQGVYDNLSEAIIKADYVNGVVTGDKGTYVWAEISKPADFQLTNVAMKSLVAAGDGNGQMAVCIDAVLAYNGIQYNGGNDIASGKTPGTIINEQIKDKTGYEISGCSLNEMLYYVCKGQPVIAANDANNYLIIVGYDFYNAVLLSPVTGQLYKQGKEETTAIFAQAGNRYVVVS